MLAKRISVSLLLIAMVSLVVSAASFALFTATGENVNNTFTAGTVSFDDSFPCADVSVTNIAPGDADSAAGSCTVTYDGSLDAWIGLDTVSSGDLFTCDGGGRFAVTISDGTNNYDPNLPDQVVGSAPFTTGQSVTLTVGYNLALAAGNDCQGDSANVQYTVKAVQSKNNTNATNDGPVSWN